VPGWRKRQVAPLRGLEGDVNRNGRLLGLNHREKVEADRVGVDRGAHERRAQALT
jgi:hypothetical protein